jgi:hypothetical protein
MAKSKKKKTTATPSHPGQDPPALVGMAAGMVGPGDFSSPPPPLPNGRPVVAQPGVHPVAAPDLAVDAAQPGGQLVAAPGVAVAAQPGEQLAAAAAAAQPVGEGAAGQVNDPVGQGGVAAGDDEDVQVIPHDGQGQKEAVNGQGKRIHAISTSEEEEAVAAVVAAVSAAVSDASAGAEVAVGTGEPVAGTSWAERTGGCAKGRPADSPDSQGVFRPNKPRASSRGSGSGSSSGSDPSRSSGQSRYQGSDAPDQRAMTYSLVKDIRKDTGKVKAEMEKSRGELDYLRRRVDYIIDGVRGLHGKIDGLHGKADAIATLHGKVDAMAACIQGALGAEKRRLDREAATQILVEDGVLGPNAAKVSKVIELLSGNP